MYHGGGGGKGRGFPSSVIDTDILVKTTNADTTAGYLYDKITINSAYFDKAVFNPAGNESLLITPYLGTNYMEFNFAYLDAEDTAKTVDFINLPAGAILIGARIKATEKFLGGDISYLKCSIGIASDLECIMQPYEMCDITVSDTEYAEAFNFQSFNYGSNTMLKIRAVSIGDNLEYLTQGIAKVEIWYLRKKAV